MEMFSFVSYLAPPLYDIFRNLFCKEFFRAELCINENTAYGYASLLFLCPVCEDEDRPSTVMYLDCLRLLLLKRPDPEVDRGHDLIIDLLAPGTNDASKSVQGRASDPAEELCL